MKRLLKILGLILAAIMLVLAYPFLHYFPGHNLRVVEKGAFYGCRQMSGKAFEKAIRKHGIRTVVNFRGHNPGSPWYDEEVAACERAGVNHADFGWSKNSLPEPESLVQFIELVETGEKPFLVHCQGGTHRTGAAAAVYELLRGKTPDEARKQFGPAFRNAPIGQLVDLYEGSAMPFKEWVEEIYPALYTEWKARPREESAVPAAALAA